MLSSRDVAFTCDRDALDVATVGELYWPLVPAVLRDAWDAAIRGGTVKLRAPGAFWKHRLSLPFVALRDDDARN